MSIERKHIVKSYIILCEGKDAEQFLINYLESNELAQDPRFSNEIQVFDFGGNSDLGDFLMNLKNMDKFDQVSSLAIIRDAEKDYDKACHEICAALEKCGYVCSEQSGMWTNENNGIGNFRENMNKFEEMNFNEVNNNKNINKNGTNFTYALMNKNNYNQKNINVEKNENDINSQK
jgi:hypothetical protein